MIVGLTPDATNRSCINHHMSEILLDTAPRLRGRSYLYRLNTPKRCLGTPLGIKPKASGLAHCVGAELKSLQECLSYFPKN